ncbi:hypothetical protein Tco_0661962 [Tanacetum coccineum]
MESIKPSVNTVDKHKRPLRVANPVVGLTSKFDVTVFNEAIEMYVKKGEQNNIHDFDVVKCDYLKMNETSYYFYITIEAFEERKRGVYDTKVRLNWDDGSKSLMHFVLTERKPRVLKETTKRRTHPDSWQDGSGITHSGMRRRQNRKSICRGAATSKIIPPELHLLIQDALKFRDVVILDKLQREVKRAFKGKNDSESESYGDGHLPHQLEQCEDRIRSYVKMFKKSKELPLDWEYDPATASTFVAAEEDTSALPETPPPEEKSSYTPVNLAATDMITTHNFHETIQSIPVILQDSVKHVSD